MYELQYHTEKSNTNVIIYKFKEGVMKKYRTICNT